MDDDLKYVITEEERTRHDALFYSQSPKNGLLSGEQARSLFIRSRLPLSELSKIWKLSDLTRDNMLDISEFTTAMHLIQLRLRGFDIPDKLPPSLTPSAVEITEIPKITENEMSVYKKTFDWKDKSRTGYIDTETACNIMLSSGLDSYTLARIWDLSDIDRDAKLCNTEFAIALHLLRYCKKGNELDGSIDVKSALPVEFLKDDVEAKKKRHTEVQTERRKLWTIKQKLCSEMTNGLDEKLVNERIRPELNKVEERLSVLEKEETELRRSLLNLKDKSKKESFKPFDRSFLLKKCVCGEDLFKGGRQTQLGKDSVLFERLWSAEELVDDGGIDPTIEEKETNDVNFNGVGIDTQSQNQTPEIILTEVKRERNEEKDNRVNGIDSVDNSIRSAYKLDPASKKDTSTEVKTRETTLKTGGTKVGRNESFSWAAVQRRPVIQQSVTEEVFAMPAEKKLPKSMVDETVSVEHKQRGADSTDLDEQLKLLEKESRKNVDINQNSMPHVENEVTFQSAKRLESSNQNMDHLFDKFSDDHGISNGTNQSQPNPHSKLPVGRVLSNEEEKELIEAGVIKRVHREPHPRGEPTQEDLLPMFMEEKRRAEEERRKRREEEEEKIRQAREELKRQDEENRQQLLSRKAAIQEAKGKLEKQISQTEHIVPKTDTSRLIEQELAQQRKRDEEARQRMEQFHSNGANDQFKHEVGGNKIQPKQINIESSPTMEHKPHFTAPAAGVRRQNPEQITRNQNSRKSWIELEIEQQKLKDEQMKREIEERQKDFSRLSHGQKHIHSVKRDIEISEEPIVQGSSSRSVESQPSVNFMQASQMFSKPPTRNNAQVQSKSVTKPKVPSTAPVVSANFQARGDMRSLDNVDSGMTAEEAKIERRVLEEEERRRLEQIEKIRQESQKREAEELVRQKNLREEELRRKKEQHLREAEKIKREEYEREQEALRHAEQRRFTFAAEKVKLEERVIRTMQENVSESSLKTRIPSTSSEPSRRQTSPSPSEEAEEDKQERRRSVRDAMSLFEKSAEQPKVVMRQKRQSLNLDDTATVSKPSKNTNRASFYSDAVVSKEKKTTNALQIISLEEQSHQNPPSRLALGNISSKRQQFESGKQKSVENEKPQSLFSSTISNSKIQKEMAELQRKEEEIRSRREGFTRAPSTERDTVDGIKRNPLPNKMQVKRQAPSIPVSKQEPQQKSAPQKQPTVKKSFIEMEKEKERKREEALQREREAVLREREAVLMRNEVEQDTSKSKDSNKKRPVSGGWLYK